MNSCLYECQVMHARFSPRRHAFSYRIFLFAIDLDELAALDHRLSLFSSEGHALYSFRDADFLPTNQPAGAPLKARVQAVLQQHGVDLSGGRVVLITLPRVAGFLFNPVSFYFCFDRTGQPVAAIPEVTNTFREMKPFFLGPSTRDEAGRFHLRVPKHFYVSPFSDVDVAFDFLLPVPDNAMAIQIDDYIGEERTLTSRLTGSARPLTDSRLAWFTVLYPLITLRIITLIHWHALRLFLKSVPWFRKSARAADQRDLLRPHSSILQPKASDA